MPRTTPRRLVVLACIAAVIGLLAGVMGYLFVRLTALGLNLTLAHRVGWDFPNLSSVHPGWWLLPIAVVGGLVVAVMAEWDELIRGHGVPEAMEAVISRQSRISLKTAFAKPTATSLTIATGGPFGAEGPIIVTGGAIGSLLGQALRVSPAERKILLAAGAAAGMSAIFGAPIGAVLLAIELLLFEFTTRAFVPLVIASVLADGVHTALIKRGPLFTVPAHHFAGLSRLPFYAVLGLAAGLLAVVITRGAYATEDVFERLPIPRFWHPVIGALGFALIGLAVPRALGVGYDVIGDAVGGHLTIGILAAVFAAKLAAWWFALGSGTSGSALAPLLLIGASASGLVGAGFEHLAPGLGINSGAFALVGMAATFGAAAGAPFTSIAFVVELTRTFDVVLPIMLATVIAHMVATWLMDENLMTEKLARHGLRVSTEYRVDILQVTSVREAMSPDPDVLDSSVTVGEARGELRSPHVAAALLVDADGAVQGVLTRGDLLRHPRSDDAPALDVASRDVVSARPEESAFQALHRMATERVGQLPVLDAEGRLLGMISRSDLLGVEEIQIERERYQRGWLARFLDRRQKVRTER